MTHKEENDLIIQAVKWAIGACDAFHRAGGSIRPNMDKLSDDLIITMVRNYINFDYKRLYDV